MHVTTRNAFVVEAEEQIERLNREAGRLETRAAILPMPLPEPVAVALARLREDRLELRARLQSLNQDTDVTWEAARPGIEAAVVAARTGAARLKVCLMGAPVVFESIRPAPAPAARPSWAGPGP